MNKLKPIIVLLLICLVASACLAFFNELTKEAIAEQDVRAEKEALEAVMPGVNPVKLSQSELDQVCDLLTFEDQVIQAIYRAEKDSQMMGYIFRTTAKGYGGAITVITGINNNGIITGVKVISHSETAGLGAKAAENEADSWISQYNGKAAGGLNVVKTGNASEHEIDAITSATKTSRAVTRAVNIAGDAFEMLEAE